MLFLASGSAIILMVIWAGFHNRISLYSPLMLSALVWQAVFVSGLAYGDRFYPLTESAFFMWLTWFLVTSVFYFFLSVEQQPVRESELRRLPIDYTLILVGVLLWLVYHIWTVGNVGPAHFFFNLRHTSSQVVGFASLGFLDRLYPWVFALFIFEHVNASAENRRLRILLWCAMLLYALATMTKFGILTPFLAWAVIKGIRGTLPARKLLVLVPFLFCIMVALQFSRDGKAEQFVFGKFLSIYTYSPIVALGYMDTPIDAPFGAHVFRFVYVLTHALIGGSEPVQALQHYSAVPYMTNVYTVIRPFAVDFGMVGVLFGATAYGLIFGLMFRFAGANRQLPLIIYAGLSVVLVAQFFDDLLFTMFSGHLQFIIAALFFSFQSRRVNLGN